MAYFKQAPGETLPYAVDWTGFLRDGDSIATATWRLEEGADLTDQGHEDGIHTCLISGGEEGVTYVLTSTVTTTSGLVGIETLRIRIEAD